MLVLGDFSAQPGPRMRKLCHAVCCRSLACLNNILRCPHKRFDLSNLWAALPLAASHEFFNDVIGSEPRFKGVVEGNCCIWTQMRQPTGDIALHGAVAVIAVDP